MATPNSQILAACDLGMEVVVSHPWLELDSKLWNKCQRAYAMADLLNFVIPWKKPFKKVVVICAKSWGL